MTNAIQHKIGFARILIATDFSDASRRALEYASSIARRHHSEILLTHVSPQENPILPPESTWFGEITEPERVNQQLEDLGAELRSAGFKARTVSLVGNPADEIVSSAIREGCDLIVAGTHGKTGIERFIFGSDAEAMMRDAYCPVLVVGPLVPSPGLTGWSPKKVVYAGTLEPESALVAAYAAALADEYAATFTIFHVQSTASSKRSSQVREFEEAVLQLLPGKHIPHYALNPAVEGSKFGSAIAEFATAKHIDLIVMGAKPGGFGTPHFPGGTVVHVADEAPCPVLIVHNH